MANLCSNTVSVLLGNGDGAFRPKVDYGTGLTPTSVAVGDFNRDGKLDLVVTNAGDNTVGVLGLFASLQHFVVHQMPFGGTMRTLCAVRAAMATRMSM